MRAPSLAAMLLALGLALAGCSTPAPVVAGCPPVKAWTLAEQQELKQALAALAPDSILRPAIYDYERMRDAARACRAEPKAKEP